MADQPEIIIAKNDYEFRVEVLRTLGRVEQSMRDLAGNGQPGRMGRLEEDVHVTKTDIWTAIVAVKEKLAKQTERVVGLTILVSLIMYGLVRLIG